MIELETKELRHPCSWCRSIPLPSGRDLKYLYLSKEDFDYLTQGLSHGICESCLEKQRRKLREREATK